MLKSGERQVATRREDVREDHTARYDWAAKTLAPNSYVIDLGCGIGYGAKILADAGHRVFAIDTDVETIAHAQAHFAHENIEFLAAPAEAIYLPKADAAVCFEVIEHLADPLPVLAKLCEAAPILLASVPNEDVFPWRPEYAFHHRHYRQGEFRRLLSEAGFDTHAVWGQEGIRSPVADVTGRTIVVEARAAALGAVMTEAGLARMINRERAAKATPPSPATEPQGVGHVVILGMGPTAEQYVDLAKRLGGRRRFADQVWAINGIADVVQCDLVFHMDDIRVQELRAAAAPNSNIAEMVKWLKTSPVPVITSRAHPDYPALREFPLQDVINSLGMAYFNGTAAYAAAYAIFMGATKISLFGCDFSYANSHQAEKGRGCLEFWLGFAAARGIELGFADRTSLLDTIDEPADEGVLNVYGYDFDHVLIDVIDGAAQVRFEPKENPPTAAQIEARYDHSRPTVNPALLGK